jgi:hypothetical protein
MTFYSNSSNSSNNVAPSATAVVEDEDTKGLVSRVLVEPDIAVIVEQEDTQIADQEELESDLSKDEVSTVESSAEQKEAADKTIDSKEGMQTKGSIFRFFSFKRD